MKNFFLIIFLTTSFLFSNGNDTLYNAAVTYYNNKQYDLAENILIDLEKKEYNNTLIYFILGKIYRYNDDSVNSIKYLKKFLKKPSSEKNEMYAKINLAYEYLKLDKEEYYKKSKKIVDDLIDSKYKVLGDVTFCFATVYNSYGYHYLKIDRDRNGDVEFYENAVNLFEKALEQRSELVAIANNLVVSYIRIIEIFDKEKNIKKIIEYSKKSDKILSDKKYENFTKGNFQKTKDYFYKNYGVYLNK